MLQKSDFGHGCIFRCITCASYDGVVNKVHLPISLRKKWTKTPRAIAGLAVLVAVASAGVVIAQTRESRLSPTRLIDTPRSRGTASVQSDGGVEHALMHGGSAAESAANGEVVTAGMNNWVGPVTPDERQQVPRRLSSEERNILRQEIRSASEEVYQPYRNKKR